MNEQKIAQELVAVARELTAVNWGERGLEQIRSELKDAYAKAVKAHRLLDSAHGSIYEAYVRQHGMSKEDSPEGQTAKASVLKAKSLKSLAGRTISAMNDILKEIRTLQESL